MMLDSYNFFFNKSVLADKINRENIISGKYTPSSEEESQAAAIKIQRYWRFFRIMRRTKVRAQRRKILIGSLL